MKTPIPNTREADESEARRRAKRLGLVLMAASALIAVLVLAGLWWLARGVL